MSTDSLLATMAPAERPIFQAILEEPESEAQRLVYVHWLEEHGDDRCDFIRLQLEIARRDASGEAIDVLRNREAELLAANLGRWNGAVYRRLNQTSLGGTRVEIRRWLRRWEYRRGFITNLKVTAESFVRHPRLLLELGPIDRVDLTHVNGWGERLAATPELRCIRSLALNGADYRVVRLLAKSVFCANLRTLCLASCNISRTAARELVRSPYLSNLTQLDVRGVHFQDTSARDWVLDHFAGQVIPKIGNKIERHFPNVIGEVNFLCDKSHASNPTS